MDLAPTRKLVRAAGGVAAAAATVLTLTVAILLPVQHQPLGNTVSAGGPAGAAVARSGVAGTVQDRRSVPLAACPERLAG